MAELFRKSALEKLSSPEQLDRAIVIAPSSLWVALSGGALIVAGALLWGVFGRLPVNVDANGIYMRGDHTGGVYSEVQGMITDVEVAVGDQVKRGQVIAYVADDDVSQEVTNLKNRMDAVQCVTLDSTGDVVTADNKSIVDIKAELISLTGDYELAQSTLARKQSELASAKGRMNAAKSVRDGMKSNYYDHISSLTGLPEQLDYTESQALYSSKQQYYEQAQAQSQQAQASSEQASAAYDQISQQVSSLQSAVNQLSDQLGQLRAVYAEQEAALEEWKNSPVVDEEGNPLPDEEGNPILDEESILLAEEELRRTAEQIQAAEASLGEAQEQLLALQQSQAQAKSSLDSARSAASQASENEARYQREAESAKSDFESAKAAYEAVTQQQSNQSRNQNILSNEYSQAATDYSVEQSMVQSLTQEVESLQTQVNQAQQQMDAKRQSVDTAFSAAKSSVLDSLKMELSKYMVNMEKYQVMASADGIVQEVVADVGAVVSQGGEVIKVKGQETDTVDAICYIPVSEGKKILPGMDVMIYPTTVNKQEYGHMKGNVRSVASYVTSAADMQKTLGNDNLVEAFLSNGPVVEVICSIETDDSTASGYYWSSKKGKDVTLTEGTMLTASVVTESKAPITMLIPYLKEKLTVTKKYNGQGQTQTEQTGQ